MTLTRKYIPAIGKRVTLRNFADYHANGIEHVWSHLEVKSIEGETVEVKVLNGAEPTGQIAWVPLSTIAPPIGWHSQYTIHVAPEKVETVLSWFARGIVVRQSHDMSGSMPTAFQPMDNSEQPHWQFCEVTDEVPAELCAKVFRVVRFEREEVNERVYKSFDPNCAHCKGSGRRTLAELSTIRNETVASLKAKLNTAEGLHLDLYDSETETFECHCHWGSFRKLGRSKRAKLIKEWEQQGWSTKYYPYAGGFWERTRETVVKDWE